jgi:hypothetical protein
MRLTIMLTPQWIDFILKDEARKDAVTSWKEKGHELSAHHHSVYLGATGKTPPNEKNVNGGWDGYSNYSLKEIEEYRQIMNTPKIEQHLGDLKDYDEALSQLDPNIQSGCMNEQDDVNVIPNNVKYSSCLSPGNISKSGGPQSKEHLSFNKYVFTATVNGIERKWLLHGLLRKNLADEIYETTENYFKNPTQQIIIGTVFHNNKLEEKIFNNWLDFLHRLDVKSQRSLTLSEAIESNILPEYEIQINNTSFACGDNLCSIPELKNDTCPKDCNNTKSDSRNTKNNDLY